MFSEFGLRVTREGFSVEHMAKLQKVWEEKSRNVPGTCVSVSRKDVCEVQSP